jgi:hypothetical protein
MVVDNDQQNLPPSFQVLSNQVKHAYQKVTGPKVTINVIEVDEIADADSGKPAPLVVSYVKDACIHNSH